MTEDLNRLSASPALSLPCGFDKHGRPVGPRAGEVPPVDMAPASESAPASPRTP